MIFKNVSVSDEVGGQSDELPWHVRSTFAVDADCNRAASDFMRRAEHLVAGECALWAVVGDHLGLKVRQPFLLDQNWIRTETVSDAADELEGAAVKVLRFRHFISRVATGAVEARRVEGAAQWSGLAASLEAEMNAYLASSLLQFLLRDSLSQSQDSVAFVLNGSILPRAGGPSCLPKEGAVPFKSPESMEVTVEIRAYPSSLASFLKDLPDSVSFKGGGAIELTGMSIQPGVTLIVGGGYHGKSTLLSALSAGIYNKPPGSGFCYCCVLPSATYLRSEDGRHVSNCDLSKFLSELPGNVDTEAFTTEDASGSTSMAANCMESLENDSKVLLVDEDTSAANFMALDGRMRSLISNYSITPLLYRVNGMFATLGVSTIIVVGGNGEWLDCGTKVVEMLNYSAFDVTDKARRVRDTFNYGHIQYGGRGVVHRLEWDQGLYRKVFKSFCMGSGKGNGDDNNCRSNNEGGGGAIDEGVLERDLCKLYTAFNDREIVKGIVAMASYVVSRIAKNNDINGDSDNSGGSLARKISDVTKNVKFSEIAPVSKYGKCARPRCIDVASAILRIRGGKVSYGRIEVTERVEEERKRKEGLKELKRMWDKRRK